MPNNFSPPKNLHEFQLEIEAAIKIMDIAQIAENKRLSTLVGLVQISTGINGLNLLDQAHRLAIGEITLNDLTL
jgi:hypothetical protein